MSRRNRTRKKGMHPLLAVLILLGSSAFVANSLGLFAGDSAKEFASLIGIDEGDLELEDDGEVQQEDVVWRDLLARHGSYDAAQPVRPVFAAMPDAQLVAAAPAGEVAPRASRWVGDDPPQLRLGVVMVSERSRRAVLGGVVVGVGDRVGGGTVLSIEPGVVRLLWQSRALTYDLDGSAPREFRVEQELRRLEASRDAGPSGASATGSVDANEPPGSEEGK
jgi:hypothetical protein